MSDDPVAAAMAYAKSTDTVWESVELIAANRTLAAEVERLREAMGNDMIDRERLSDEVKRLRGIVKKGLDYEHHSSCGHVWTMRHTACPECFSALRQRHAEMREALSSIARNTCCDRCQEAALVAKAALEGEHE